MLLKLAFSTALLAGLAAAQSDMDVVAVLLWGRHGDRTPKTQAIGIEGSAVLTTLGANECFESAQYFNNRYYNSSSPYFIQGITTDIDSSRSQIYASTSYCMLISSLINLGTTMFLVSLLRLSCKVSINLRSAIPLRPLLMGLPKLILSADTNTFL